MQFSNLKNKTNTTVPGVRIVVYSVPRGKVRPEGTDYFPFGHRGGRHVRDRQAIVPFYKTDYTVAANLQKKPYSQSTNLTE